MANQAVVMMVMVITLTIVAESEGVTTVYWWSATGGCSGTGNPITVGNCQCYKFPDKVAGYEIYMDGDGTDVPVTMYNDDSCGTTTFTFIGPSGYCGQYGWESVMIGSCT